MTRPVEDQRPPEFGDHRTDRRLPQDLQQPGGAARHPRAVPRDRARPERQRGAVPGLRLLGPLHRPVGDHRPGSRPAAGAPRMDRASAASTADAARREARGQRQHRRRHAGAVLPGRAAGVSRGRPGQLVTQYEFARAGIITEEMIYVAHRENMGRAGADDGAEARIADGESFGAEIPAFITPGIRAQRDRPRPRDHSGQHQSPGARAGDHRPQLPGQDQRQHRQLGGDLRRGRGGREAGLGDPLGRRHGDGPVDRPQHPQHPRLDHAQLAGADRHGADLPGAGEGRRRSGRSWTGRCSRTR